jgi:hypothetical protein
MASRSKDFPAGDAFFQSSDGSRLMANDRTVR